MFKHFRKAVLFFVIAVCAVLSFSSSAQAQLERNLSYNNNFSYGWVDRIPGGLGDGNNSEIIEVSFGGASGGLLGCLGINLDATFDAILNMLDPAEIAAKMQAYFITAIANYLLTAIYSNPALAAILDSLNAFGYANLELLQSKCNATEIKAKSAPARDEARAEAQRRCAEENNWVSCTISAASEFNLQEALDDVLGETAMSGSMWEVLGGEDAMGDLIAFVPNIRWCVNTSCSGPQRSEAPLSASRLFDFTRRFAETGVVVRTAAIADRIAADGYARVRSAVFGWEARAGYNQPNWATAAKEGRVQMELADMRLGVTHHAGFWEDFVAGSNAGPVDDLEVSFLSFINCSQPEFGKDFNDFMKSTYGLNPDQFNDVLTATGAVSATQFESQFSEGSFGGALSTIMGGKVDASLQLTAKAVACMFNHALHLRPSDFLTLADLPPGRARAITGSHANQLGYLTTEVMLRFLKNELLNEYAERAFNLSESPADDRTQLPPHVLEAIKMLAESMENKIKVLRTVHEGQQTFAEMMSLLYAERQLRRDEAAQIVGDIN